MRPEPQQSVDPRAINLWRVEGVLRSAFAFLLVLFGLGGLLAMFPLGAVAPVLAVALALAYSLLQIAIVPKVRYRRWHYQVDEHELDIQHGVFVVRRTLIPLVRVQHVDTVQGPLSKQFGLSSVTISTAAGAHLIPALSDQAADALRDHISALARVARESL